MRYKMFNRALCTMLACVLCIGLVPAAAVPAAAADLGSSEWVLRNDDFSSYPVGVDTFWQNDKYGGFSSGYHGTYGSDSYSTYGIVEEDGNKMLELVSVNETLNWFHGPEISGAYSMSFDFYMPRASKSVPGLILTLFDNMSPSLPGSIAVYIDGSYDIRLRETLTNASTTKETLTTYIKDTDGNNMVPALDTWFTVKLAVEPGKFMVKVWPRGQQEPADDSAAGVCVFKHSVLTQEVLEGGMTARIQTRSRKYAGVAHTVRMDNLKFSKPYKELILPAALSGNCGERVVVGAAFTGQDLMAQLPAPKFKYTVSDPALGRVSPGGYLALGAAGQGTLTVELADIDGKGTGVARNIALSVTDSTAGEQPLRILSIGNSYSRDTLYYLDNLAGLMGQAVESAYLTMTDATLRHHARNVAKNAAEYNYYASAAGDTAVVSTINDVVEGENWDIIMLQQGVEEAGMNNTYDADLRYLMDYLADAQPGTKVYWNMTWANQADTQQRKADFDSLYDGNQNVMYNAIVDCLNRFIVGEEAEYKTDFDGWFPVGAAIQNVRATALGDKLTRDGYQLSLQAGRLTAAMTVLKVLFPDADLTAITPEAVASFLVTDKSDEGQTFPADPAYANSAANLALICQSVEAACKNLDKAPVMLSVPAPKTVENTTPETDDVTIGQANAPMNLRFADLVTTKDGTIYVSAYESVVHVPTRGTKDYRQDGKEGYGRLKLWKSTDNGQTWDFANPLLTIDQRDLDAWEISPGLYNRYERLKNGAGDYAYFIDARDPNLGLMYYDMDGDGAEDEVLLYTFFANNFMESGAVTFAGTFLMYSIDDGETWTPPQRISSEHLSNGGGKRGDMAVFSNGQILVPLYAHPVVAAVLLQWNVESQRWDTLSDVTIKNYVPEKTTDFTEPSYIAPDPDGDTVYGFIRDNGQAVVSYDRGRSWEHIHTIEGNVQQPGWAYIDENRAFATWSFSAGPCRDTKGQMVYFDAGWKATQPQLIHENYYRTPHDAGDPSSKLLADGRLLTIMYDVSFRAINGKFLDPDDPEFQLPELSADAAEITLHTQKPVSANFTVGENLPVSHTINTTATFTASGGLTVTVANGAVLELAAGKYGIAAGKATELRIAVINGATYVKAWPVGGAEPEDWTGVKGGTDQNSGKADFSGSGVTVGEVSVTRRAILIVGEGGAATAGMASTVPYTVNPADMAEKITWTTNEPAIAAVDDKGVVAFKSAGSVTITASIADKSASITYKVRGAAAEITGTGQTQVLFFDDFEDYAVGTDAFLEQMVSKGYGGLSGSESATQTGYNVVEKDGNKYLELVGKDGKYAWCVVDVPIAGDYTVQFDFFHSEDSVGKGTTFFNLWQTTSVYAMVQMPDDHFRVQHIDAQTGDYTNSPTFYSHDIGVWNTMKIARGDGGLFVKVWPQGTPEPISWQYSVLAEEMDTNNTAKFRFSVQSKEDVERAVLFDNLIITQQQRQTAARGTFSKKVVKTIVLDGQKWDFCRWVWTCVNGK